MKRNIRIHKTEPNVNDLDFSWLLDAPAGKHGFVKVRDGHLVFEDGTRARFIGFNMPTRSNTPDHETAEKLAKRFASLGMNVVRLHAADCTPGDHGWSSSQDHPLIDYASGTSRKFTEEGLDRFDYFCAKLKEAGIYMHLDLLVARVFQPGDELDYPDPAPFRYKCFTHLNGRLIELQKEYARNLLLHVNPYTGLALVDDPAFMTVQISNEDSFFGGTEEINDHPGIAPYRRELVERFNAFLLQKYGSRKHLEEAWTFEGVSALGPEEDPAMGTVIPPKMEYQQCFNDPAGEWGGTESPARYGDYMEFGMGVNRHYYQEMKGELISIGVKVPIATSNLLNGAADVYSHTDADIMENNCYFNHPIPPFEIPMNGPIRGAGLAELVSTNPVMMHKRDGMFLRTTLLTMGATAAVADKPFLLSEWNEYGLMPFHSTAFLQMAVYACLNDWDGLIMYCYCTSENWDDQPADRITNVFDAYNDPSMICELGSVAAIFLKGLVSKAKHQADVVFTTEDLKTLPPQGRMPNSVLPYVMNMRNVFLQCGEHYAGGADVALTSGYTRSGCLDGAGHGIYDAWIPYRDASRHALGAPLPGAEKASAQGEEPVSYYAGKDLVFPDIRKAAGEGDYSVFAGEVTAALQKWGILDEGTGYVDGVLVSDTKEIVFDPDHVRFQVDAESVHAFSGRPEGEIRLGQDISLKLQNERITAIALERENKIVLTLLGETGNDETTYTQEGFFTSIDFQGKLYADVAEGTLTVAAPKARLTALDTTGHELVVIPGESNGAETVFTLDGSVNSVNFVLEIIK